MDIKQILEDRAKTHGKYSDHAKLTIETLDLWHALSSDFQKPLSELTYSQRETLHMIAHKIGRIIAGDPNVADHWDDIAGYAKLIGDQIREQEGK